jgi:S1-C subfamily serine protease
VDLSDEDTSARVSGPEDLPSAVGILGTDRGSGTAFVISKQSRLVMTCCHVVEDARRLTFRINALGGEETPGTVVWMAPRLDMAIVRVESLPEGAKYVGLYPEGAPTVAPLTPIVHCGFPLGEKVSKNLMINSGEVNNYEKDRNLSGGRRADVYISSIPAAPGCSGGPVLLTESLRVIGLLQGAFEHVGNVGVRIIPDIASVYRDANITITNP